MKDPLKKDKIAISGDFGSARTSDAIKRWIELNGGTYTTSVTSDTTHLICSKAHWGKQVAAVKKALSHKDIKVVSYDWLEDTLHSRSHKRETAYLWKVLDRTALKKRAAKERAERSTLKREGKAAGRGGILGEALKVHVEELGVDDRRAGKVRVKRGPKKNVEVGMMAEEAPDVRRFEKGCKAAANDILSDNYHIYTDETGFEYAITVTKIDVARNRNERHHLKLYESNSLPPTYSTHVLSSSPVSTTTAPTSSISIPAIPTSTSTSTTLTPLGSNYGTAFLSFRQFFRAKTGRWWSERLDPPAKPQHAGAKAPLMQWERTKDLGDIVGKKGRPRKGNNDGEEASGGEKEGEQEMAKAKTWAEMGFAYRAPPADQPRGTLLGVVVEADGDGVDEGAYEMVGLGGYVWGGGK
ncbi:hypothetical protein B0A49_03328 [Cryomyces minteri]|uniref:Uncharacterized protein n=1 Tax=Cryomyces minteri TaxID=331657 RepID=A0A4U0XGW6_9PEZI|nr:hypothetical protein B0A49_03328 [Cryomyces minteri]